MSFSRLSFTLILSILLAGCGARSFGGPSEDAGGVDPDAGPLFDGAIPHAEVYGYVTIAHAQDRETPNYHEESLMLGASFYEEPWDVGAPYFGWPEPELVETPDGVHCEIRYVSGMDGPMPPEPPVALDGGEISAWAGFDGADTLEVFFSPGGYDTDYRTPGNAADWPAWMTDGALAIQLESAGSAQAAPFYSEVIMAETPQILAPPLSSDEPLTPGPDGNYLISWSPVDSDRLEVTFSFNMDWDDSHFRCYPDSSRSSMLLPHQWLEEYSWGFGRMTVLAVNERRVSEGDTYVVLRSTRMQQRNLNVLVWE